MRDNIFSDIPVQYDTILNATTKLNFNMPSDLQTGSLLKTLTASKPNSNILELGTGSGLATSWILSGMDKNSRLTTIDNNEILLEIAKTYLNDDRINFVCADGYEWLNNKNLTEKYDLIFADAMPGKYDLFDEGFSLLKVGGFFFIDDMLPQPNWPEDHELKVEKLIKHLEERQNIALTKLNWSTGIIIITKIN